MFFFQAEDGIRDLVRSRGLGDVYKRQARGWTLSEAQSDSWCNIHPLLYDRFTVAVGWNSTCLLYTSDAADERSSVDLGGRRIIKKKTNNIVAYNCICSTNVNDSA